MTHQIIKMADEFAVFEGMSEAQMVRLEMLARKIEEITREAAAKQCFERADQWHQQYWQAINSGRTGLAFHLATLRDEAAECKNAIRIGNCR